jgi:hypothetical protein
MRADNAVSVPKYRHQMFHYSSGGIQDEITVIQNKYLCKNKNKNHSKMYVWLSGCLDGLRF